MSSIVRCVTLVALILKVTCINGNMKKCDTYNGSMVNCSSRALSRVPPDIPDNTTSLNLRHNNIIKLYDRDFQHLKFLHNLDISFNSLLCTIEKSAFFGLNSLVILIINGHNLNYSENSLPNDVFEPLISLQNLSFRSNLSHFNQPYGTYTFEADRVIWPLENLTYLNIDTLPNTKFSANISLLSNLRYIVLGKIVTESFVFPCGISILSNETFSAFENLPIEFIDLSGCILERFEHDALIHFPNLKYFIFNGGTLNSGNVLNILAAFSIYKNKNMTQINITWLDSNMATLNGGVSLSFNNLSQICIQTLVLIGCSINTVEFDDLSNTSYPFNRCIRNLIFKHNRISGSIIKIAFLFIGYFLSNIEYIDLSEQRIFEVASNPVLSDRLPTADIPIPIPFYMPTNLKYINIAGFPRRIGQLYSIYAFNAENMVHFDISYCGLYNFNRTLTGLTNVEVLYLSGNDLSIINEEFFDTFPNLKDLRMDNTFLDNELIMRFGKRLFSKLFHLQKLNIAGNKLMYLPSDIFTPLLSIREINLAYNSLVIVPDIRCLPDLTSLFIQFNSITTLDLETRMMLDKVVMRNKDFQMKLSGNTLFCSCEALDFIMWLNVTKVNLDGRNYTCMDMSGKITATLEVYNKLQYYQRKCTSPFWLNLAIGGVGFQLLTLIATFVVVKKKMKLTLFVQRVLGRFVYPKTRAEFPYDAFIIYSDSICSWVCREMCEQLETTRNIQLNLRHRDEPCGYLKADYISESIKDSWKIIFILTPDFLETDLAFFTMCSCLQSMTLTTPHRLILLLDQHVTIQSNLAFFLEGIPEDNILYINLQQNVHMEFWESLAELITRHEKPCGSQ